MVEFLVWAFGIGCLFLSVLLANLFHNNEELENEITKRDSELTKLRIENEDLRYKLNFKVPPMEDTVTVKFGKE